MSTTQPTVPEWVSKIAALNLYLIRDFLGGSRPITIAFAINAHKFLTAFIVFYLMWKFNNYSKEMWVYLALHGSYGFCWLLKHFTFRDPKWEQKSTIGGSVFLFIFLFIAFKSYLKYLKGTVITARLLTADIILYSRKVRSEVIIFSSSSTKVLIRPI